MKIEQYGFPPSAYPNNNAGVPARITAVYRNRYEVVCDAGAGLAHLKTGAYHTGEETVPTVGDFVLLDWQKGGESRILKTLPRKTYFARLDPSASGHGEQAVAANFDYVFLLQSLDRDFNPRRLERYLTLAWQSGAVPVVLLTKADQAADATAQTCAAAKHAVGVDVFAVSARSGLGLDRLTEYCRPGKTIVFLGSSGVGKSSLINAIAGEKVMETGGVRESDGRGRHTTTRRQLLLLQNGALVIDTPGMRELGMWDVSEGLGQSFSDVEQYLGRCKFSDCRHQSEPGCAVKAAIQSGALPRERWESYLQLHREARYTGEKADFLREKEKWQKDIAKRQKQREKAGRPQPAACEHFTCKVCGALVTPEGAGSRHRNHCPQCLASVHADHLPGDRASFCNGIMDPIGVWVRKNGEWAIIHRCRACGALHSNRIAADDNPNLLLSIAAKPLAAPPFPLWRGSADQGE